MVIGQMERPLFRLVIKIIPAGGATSAKQLLLMAVHRPNMIGIDPYSHVRTHTHIYNIYICEITSGSMSHPTYGYACHVPQGSQRAQGE